MWASRLPHLGELSIACALLIPFAGCGEDDADRDPAQAIKREDARITKDPYALTCERVQAIETNEARRFHLAAFALAEDAPVHGINRQKVWARMVYALLDICQRRNDPEYRPAKEAVREVRAGKYFVGVEEETEP
jgi:hypothetical protein